MGQRIGGVWRYRTAISILVAEVGLSALTDNSDLRLSRSDGFPLAVVVSGRIHDTVVSVTQICGRPLDALIFTQINKSGGSFNEGFASVFVAYVTGSVCITYHP